MEYLTGLTRAGDSWVPSFVVSLDHNNCIGCGRCYLSCYDGGHQALGRDETTRKPVFIPTKCVGCHLCVTVCPVSAIAPGTRVPKSKLKTNNS